jgi:hypothetical protein
MTPFSTPFKDLLHAANLRHGAKGFTSLPKEGLLRIFSYIYIYKRKEEEVENDDEKSKNLCRCYSSIVVSLMQSKSQAFQ